MKIDSNDINGDEYQAIVGDLQITATVDHTCPNVLDADEPYMLVDANIDVHGAEIIFEVHCTTCPEVWKQGVSIPVH